MNDLNHFRLRVGCVALLLCLSAGAGADEMQDASRLFKQSQYAEAMERVNVYLASSPKDAQARFLKGLIFTEQGKTSDAITVFAALTHDYPELPEPHNNLAVLYAGQGQYDKAKNALEMAIRTNPSYATAQENLGDIYAKMASQAYDRALQLDSNNAGTQTKLAMIKDLFNGKSKNDQAVISSEIAPPKVIATTASINKSPPVIPMATLLAAKAAAPAIVGKSSENSSKEVLKMLNSWAAAWSSKNATQYFAFYAKDFKTPDGESRDHWSVSRAERLSKPKFIQVGVNNAKVSFTDDTHATVTFRQSYRSSHLKANSKKTLLLVYVEGAWLIQEERSGK